MLSGVCHQCHLKDDVKEGVDFAWEDSIRLIVKGTGVDYLGRSAAPNSLSIWTLNMKKIVFHDSFKPQGCRFAIGTSAMTATAGPNMGEVNLAASLKNLTLLSASKVSVSHSRCITGGGHDALADAYGLAADNLLQMEIVTPGGDI